MTPKLIEHSDFKYREEIANEVVEKLIIEGGSEKVKECLTNVWGYNPEDNVAVPILMIGQEGKAVGAKWVVVGKIQPKAVKAEQLWKDSSKDIFIDIRIPDMTIFSFYNKCRNVSGWLDCDALNWSVFKNENKKKVSIPVEKYQEMGVKKFCLRICVLPNSVSTVALTLALVPLSKDDLKKRVPEHYSKSYCPQVALTLGEKTTRATVIKLGVAEPVTSKTGMKVWPLLEDLRAIEHRGQNVTSIDVRKCTAKFLRTVQGLNNKLPKNLDEAFEEVKNKPTASEPEWLWPESHSIESSEPLVDQGGLKA